MVKADFKARVKKIEIVNRVLTDGWAQSIRLVLEDIELTDENLLELRQFKPNEAVMVVMTPVQMTLFDQVPAEKPKNNLRVLKQDVSLDGQDEEEFVRFIEGDQPPAGRTVKEWKF